MDADAPRADFGGLTGMSSSKFLAQVGMWDTQTASIASNREGQREEKSIGARNKQKAEA